MLINITTVREKNTKNSKSIQKVNLKLKLKNSLWLVVLIIINQGNLMINL